MSVFTNETNKKNNPICCGFDDPTGCGSTTSSDGSLGK